MLNRQHFRLLVANGIGLGDFLKLLIGLTVLNCVYFWAVRGILNAVLYFNEAFFGTRSQDHLMRKAHTHSTSARLRPFGSNVIVVGHVEVTVVFSMVLGGRAGLASFAKGRSLSRIEGDHLISSSCMDPFKFLLDKAACLVNWV